jgi:hypothetical protein
LLERIVFTSLGVGRIDVRQPASFGLGPSTPSRSASARRRKARSAAAIANAVARALGTRIRDLPLTRDRIMAALLTGG